MDDDRPDEVRDDGIDRRSFLKYSAIAGVAASTAAGLGVAATPHALAATATGGDSFRWNEATIADLQAAMASGDTSALHLARDYMRRIEEKDFSGPKLNSVIELNPDAEAIAAARDRERHDGHVRGPLHGIPILVKDNVATDDKMETCAGSVALLGSKVPRDAGVTKALRAAGAVILGKANLSEWANFRSFQSSSGWTGRAGQCLMPYALDHNASGSSSGSAAAVAANFAAAAIGTETDGSIVSPATTCGVVGLKPTLGLTSRSGVIPIAHSQDTTGPMCRTVADAATVLSALVGVDPFDDATKMSVGHWQRNYTRFLDPNGLRGARIGIWREGNFGLSPESDAVVESVIPVLRHLGATVVDPADIPHAGELFNAEVPVLLYEFKHDIAVYLSGLAHTAMRTLADLIRFNDSHASREMPWFGQEVFELAQTFGPLSDPAYKDALRNSKRLSRQEGILAIMNEHHLDAIFAPTGQPSWTIDLVNGDHFLNSDSSPAAVAGYPHITVPAGFTGELPIGVSFMGKPWSEPKLIKYAFAFEHEVKARRAPKFLPSYAVHDFIPPGGRNRAEARRGAATDRMAPPKSAPDKRVPKLL